MKTAFIVWITFQLIVIGITSVTIHNEVFNKTYECGANMEVPEYIGVIFPLQAFTPEPQVAIDYCNSKEL